MKQVLKDSNVKKKNPDQKKYVRPQVIATTGKASMSGAGCPEKIVQWQQVSCKC